MSRTLPRRQGPPAVVILDFDGTLADTWRDIATAVTRTLADAHLPAPAPEAVRGWIGHGVRALLERALPEPERTPDRLAAHAARFGAHYEKCCLDTTRLYPGIADCLTDLGDHTLAVLSNKPERFLFPMVEGLGIASHFVAVAGGDTLPARKPDPAVLRDLLTRLPTTASRTYMVGDSAVDVTCGKAAGAITLGCAWGLRGRAELEAAGSDHVLEQASEIAPLVNL